MIFKAEFDRVALEQLMTCALQAKGYKVTGFSNTSETAVLYTAVIEPVEVDPATSSTQPEKGKKKAKIPLTAAESAERSQRLAAGKVRKKAERLAALAVTNNGHNPEEGVQVVAATDGPLSQ